MSTDDQLGKRGRALEEDYFRRKDQELIEKMREKVAAERAQQALGATTGLTDPALLQELQTLGFTLDTVSLLPLVPVLQVAWAEGGVTAGERNLIRRLAEVRGIKTGTPADAQLTSWLEHRPPDAVFAGAGRLIRAMMETNADVVGDLSADDLVAYSEKVAAASGGVFGIGRVSGEERELLASIAADLKGRRS
ncbi:MAG: hypothetical protein GEU82_04635 [Luteitalea sp.]|nr:hypothetical protein [Luteitalea sp.]